MLYTGIDSIEIDRFKDWHLYAHKQLLKIFSQEEIDYCLSVKILSAQRFAARFAAREALYKAVHAGLLSHQLPFFPLCKLIAISKNSFGAPFFNIDWQKMNIDEASITCSLSWTHTKITATAIVILTKN